MKNIKSIVTCVRNELIYTFAGKHRCGQASKIFLYVLWKKKKRRKIEKKTEGKLPPDVILLSGY